MAKPETLQTLIDAKGLALQVLAKRCGLSVAGLGKLRAGIVALPRVTTVARLAKVLGVDPSRVRAACEASRAAAGK